MIDEVIKQKLIENNHKIQSLLKENEEILKNQGFNPPIHNFVINPEKNKIHFPSGYIRTASEFWKKYHLKDIVKKRNTRKNISYCLQLSDFYNFIENRFYLWGSVETMLYKQDFVNLVSIIESLVLEAANNISTNCSTCNKISKCKKHISKQDKNNMKSAIKKMNELGMINLSIENIERIIELYNLRNRIHIRLADNNEFLDNKFNLKLHNETILLLIEITEDLYNSAIQYYVKCVDLDN